MITGNARLARDSDFDISCSDLVRIYRTRNVEVQALQGLNLNVRRGEMVAVVGASGSGKSTLLGILSGLDSPSAGQASVAGYDLAALTAKQRTTFHRYAVGFVWQQTARNLLPFLTAAQNIAAVLAVAGRPRSATGARTRTERISQVLELVGIEELRDKHPVEMSGGQQQRVALAVALANAPSVLLADEPTGALDADTSAEVLETMRLVNERSGVTTLIVTHDSSVAEHVRRTVQIRDGRSSTETLRRTSSTGNLSEQFSVIDRVGRLQLPESFQVRLGLQDRVRLRLQSDRIEVLPGHEVAEKQISSEDDE